MRQKKRVERAEAAGGDETAVVPWPQAFLSLPIPTL